MRVRRRSTQSTRCRRDAALAVGVHLDPVDGQALAGLAMSAPLDGMGPRCVRDGCGLPFHWTGTFAPFCGAICACKAAREAMKAGQEEEMRGRKGWQKEGAST